MAYVKRERIFARWTIPLGNLLFRPGGSIAALIAIEALPLSVALLGSSAGDALVNLHVVFNGLLIAPTLPLGGPMATLTGRIIAEPRSSAAEEHFALQRLSALDRNVMATPTLALASATRERLRMGELIEQMFRPVMDMLERGTAGQIVRLRRLDEEVDDAHTGIKLYIAEVNHGVLTEEDARRGIELTNVAINLEHAGDIIAKNLLVPAIERAEKRLQFSVVGRQELASLHQRVSENLPLALNTFISNDVASARRLVAQKENVCAMEGRSHEATFAGSNRAHWNRSTPATCTLRPCGHSRKSIPCWQQWPTRC